MDVQHVSHKLICKKLDLERMKFLALKLVSAIFLLLKTKYIRYSVKTTWKTKRHWEDQIEVCKIMEIASGHLCSLCFPQEGKKEPLGEMADGASLKPMQWSAVEIHASGCCGF